MFKPSHPNKHGWHGTLAKFPEYKPNPPKELKRKVVDDSEPKKEVFKPNHLMGWSRPSSTISCNRMNIRRAVSSMGRRL